MKKILILMALFAAVSCEAPKDEQPQEPTFAGSNALTGKWQPVQKYASTSIDGEIQVESTVDIDAPESYRLTFNSDGFGTGSNPNEYENGEFRFRWILFYRSRELHFIANEEGWIFRGLDTSEVYWNVEELTADRLVVSYETATGAMGQTQEGGAHWIEENYHRYTFEKVVEP